MKQPPFDSSDPRWDIWHDIVRLEVTGMRTLSYDDIIAHAIRLGRVKEFVYAILDELPQVDRKSTDSLLLSMLRVNPEAVVAAAKKTLL